MPWLNTNWVGIICDNNYEAKEWKAIELNDWWWQVQKFHSKLTFQHKKMNRKSRLKTRVKLTKQKLKDWHFLTHFWWDSSSSFNEKLKIMRMIACWSSLFQMSLKIQTKQVLEAVLETFLLTKVLDRKQEARHLLGILFSSSFLFVVGSATFSLTNFGSSTRKLFFLFFLFLSLHVLQSHSVKVEVVASCFCSQNKEENKREEKMEESEENNNENWIHIQHNLFD